jgi:asparagine synthase (glutamine-hydrolysing)
MCGIFGIVADRARIDPEMLERATRSLAHRGPDDQGTVIVEGRDAVEAGLGSRRLAILDLSPLGHQPMQDEESGNWIAYNGEIYNFQQVREKLAREGVNFASHSDTEVLLKAYRRWGERCLEEVRGMFAFAIWDAAKQRLFVARDPMGIKPLYYSQAGQYFLFASEVRTLLATGLIPRRLSRAGIISYLSFGSAYDPITLVDGVWALPPGHCLVWEKGRVQERAYWDMIGGSGAEDGAQDGDRTRRIERMQATLDEAVRMQMVSDVPVGAFLSGGIDSSALVGILSRGGIKLDTFSIVFREAEYDEAAYSRLVAKQYGTNHHEILVSQGDALEAIPGALSAIDQPTMDGLNTYFISQQTRAAGIKVALSGLGGDELFGGYSSFRTVPKMERFSDVFRHVPGSVRGPLAGAMARLLGESDQKRKLAALVRGNGFLVHPYFLSRLLFTPGQRDRLMKVRERTDVELADAACVDTLGRAKDLDPINRVSYLESRCYMANTLLRDSDVMSMAHGLELRVPLIDHRLAAESLALPGRWKMEGGSPKRLLVGALGGSLPEEIVKRRKRGFTFPLEHWLRENLRGGVEKTLGGMRDGPLGSILDQGAVGSIWEDFQRRRTSWSRPWSLFVLERWCEANAVSG